VPPPGADCCDRLRLPARRPPTLSPSTRTQNLIFRFLQSRQKIQVWVFEQTDLRIEGRIIGFDEYMNLTLDEAEEVSVKRKTRRPLGRILLKGDTITLMQAAK
jgi:small nuclear ribonucleoprotein E